MSAPIDLEHTAHAGAWWSAANRIDPYWDGLWSDGQIATWMSASLARRRQAAGLGHLPARWQMDPATAIALLTSPSYRRTTLAVLGVIDQWRTVTLEQLAALSGSPRLAQPDNVYVRALFASGLVDFAVATGGLVTTADARARMTLLRPARTAAFNRHIAPQLSYAERLAVTAGMPWSNARQADRHNILSVELGARAAELCEVGAVLGEKLSTTDLLAYTGLGRERPSGLQSGADLTLVRTDGMRIAVELTATITAGFRNKVDRWASILANTSMDHSGLTVLFVEAASPDRTAAPGRSVRSDALFAIEGAVRRYPGTASGRVAERIAVASWQDLFPGPHQVSPGFARLRAQRPTGPSDAPWEQADLLDVFDMPFTPADPDAARAVLSAAPMLAGTPAFLDAAPPDHSSVLAALRSSVGIHAHPGSPARPGRPGAQLPPGAPRGVAGRVQVPPRMVWPQG